MVHLLYQVNKSWSGKKAVVSAVAILTYHKTQRQVVSPDVVNTPKFTSTTYLGAVVYVLLDQ